MLIAGSRLNVSDNSRLDEGTLDSWSMTVTVQQ